MALKLIVVLLALCLLMAGCAPSGDAFLRYERSDHPMEVVGKSLANFMIGCFYVTGYIAYVTLAVLADCAASCGGGAYARGSCR